jgi:hypothetical protein
MRALARRIAAALMRYGTWGEWTLTVRATCPECDAPSKVVRVDVLAAMGAGEHEERW